MSVALAPRSQQAQSLKPGIYRHYKNKEYLVHGVARYSEDLEQELVVYQSLPDEQWWVRPLAMFLEEVEVDGRSVPRFEWVRNE